MRWAEAGSWGAGGQGFAGHSKGFRGLIPGPLGQRRKVAGKAQRWFCKTSFLHHLLLESQARLSGVAEKAWGVLNPSLPLLTVLYLNTTSPHCRKGSCHFCCWWWSLLYSAPHPILSTTFHWESSSHGLCRGESPAAACTEAAAGSFLGFSLCPHTPFLWGINIKCLLMSEAGWPGTTLTPSWFHLLRWSEQQQMAADPPGTQYWSLKSARGLH